MENKKVDLKKLSDSIDLNEAIVNNNYLPFSNLNDFGEVVESLRINRLSAGEEINLANKINEQKLQMLQDSKYLTCEKIIEKYLEKGIDISEFDKKWEEITKEQEQYQNNLTEINNTPKETPEEINRLKSKIKELDYVKMTLMAKKMEYLSCSIENQLRQSYDLYYTYLATEKQVDEKWIKKWSSYEKMLEDDAELVAICLGKAIQFMSGMSNNLFGA